MKKPTIKETELSNNQRDVESTKEWINRTLKEIHREMAELFDIDFAYFNDIRIIKQSGTLKQLTQHMRDDLKENGVVYSDTEWKQICESLLKNQVSGFFENLAFYNPKDGVLYINEKMITNHPERIIPVCIHELSEKLLSTHLSSPLKTPTRALVEAYIKAKKAKNKRNFIELLNTHADIVFKNVFKEGCCEVIALQTMRHMGCGMKAASLEKELLVGHSKCIDVLFELDKAKSSIENIEKNRTQLNKKRHKIREIDEDKLVKEIIRRCQIIKGISYYLGYPVAKAVLEKYGIRGLKVGLEKYPPHKAQHFADPHAYVAKLEEVVAINDKRR